MEHTYAQCKDTCVGYRHSGENPLPVKKRESSCERYNKGFAWLDMRQARAIWLKRNVRGAGIKLNKTGKAHDNAFTTRYKGSPGGYRPA